LLLQSGTAGKTAGLNAPFPFLCRELHRFFGSLATIMKTAETAARTLINKAANTALKNANTAADLAIKKVIVK